MAKEIVGQIKLQIPAGQANPAPPVGPALGQQGVNIMAFCKEFNATTQKQAGDILPVVITVYKDKSFSFITKSPPASILLRRQPAWRPGSKEPNKTKVAKLSKKQMMEIVKIKMKDLTRGAKKAPFGQLAERPARWASRSAISFRVPRRSRPGTPAPPGDEPQIAVGALVSSAQ